MKNYVINAMYTFSMAAFTKHYLDLKRKPILHNGLPHFYNPSPLNLFFRIYLSLTPCFTHNQSSPTRYGQCVYPCLFVPNWPKYQSSIHMHFLLVKIRNLHVQKFDSEIRSNSNLQKNKATTFTFYAYALYWRRFVTIWSMFCHNQGLSGWRNINSNFNHWSSF